MSSGGHAWGFRMPDVSVGFPPDGHITVPGLYDTRDPGDRAETCVHGVAVSARCPYFATGRMLRSGAQNASTAKYDDMRASIPSCRGSTNMYTQCILIMHNDVVVRGQVQ